MIDLKQALSIHSVLIERFGGSHGIRDKGLLESALNRPFATFDNIELYPTSSEKAAAILESMLINHPFVDGNKRTAYVFMRLILMDNQLDIQATDDEKYELILAASMGDMRFEEIRFWIDQHLLKRNEP